MTNKITHLTDFPDWKQTAEIRAALAEKLRLFRLEKKRTERKK